ncbi:MAG TPA: hypothetical protein VFQ61_39360, partial [Polyangiaceae bacterium]|nr:hypothetical protein [Polyangiaceae bacterium]
MRLTDEELKVISSPVFQRLRRIKQNGLLSYVFPAATHTRFEHSVGVLFVVESMLQAIVANSIVANEKKELGTDSLSAVDIRNYRHNLAFLFRTARLAALCHDLGHGPFSHAFDKFAPRRENVAALLEADSAIVNKRLADAIRSDTGKRVAHEWMSCVLFARLFEDLNGNVDDDTALVVAAAIHDSPELAPDPSTRSLIPLIHDLIASAPADADRMDYVERDSRSCGVTYGLFDRDRVLKSFLCYADEGKLRLGIKSSGFRAIENFVQARFQLFVQVYYHKTNRAIELMLGKIGKIAEERDLCVMREDSLDSLIDDYVAIG